jgi:hypothetical protein
MSSDVKDRIRDALEIAPSAYAVDSWKIWLRVGQERLCVHTVCHEQTAQGIRAILVEMLSKLLEET